MRMRHPPENSFVFFFCISGVNCSPVRMAAARASAVDASRASSFSYKSSSVSLTLAMASSSRSPSVSRSVSASVCFSILARSSSAVSTASSAVMSEASISRSTRYESICSGKSTSRLPIAVSSVDLPHPFGPSNPYRCPWFRMSAVSSSRRAEWYIRLSDCTLTSREDIAPEFELDACVTVIASSISIRLASSGVISDVSCLSLARATSAALSSSFTSSLTAFFLPPRRFFFPRAITVSGLPP
mmetsp:Transcript_49266/g.118460  ORF Transcript_49266/g.118460 Transcript_49266/m.118460 type:complete len:243 (-) Transcript_49266:8-736(-)